MNFTRFVDIAKALKLTHQTGRCFHCSLAIKQKKIICIGINNYQKTGIICHQYIKRKSEVNFNNCLHSEADLISKMKRVVDFSQYTIVNIRIDNNGKITNAHPCINCSAWLRRINFKKLYFSTDYNNFEIFN